MTCYIRPYVFKGYVSPVLLYFIRIESVPPVYWSNFHVTTQNGESVIQHMHDSLQKTTFHFFVALFQSISYLPFLQGTEANKQNACNSHILSKIQFPKKLRRKHLLNLSSAILRLDWSRLWFGSLQNSEKVFKSSKSM